MPRRWWIAPTYFEMLVKSQLGDAEQRLCKTHEYPGDLASLPGIRASGVANERLRYNATSGA